MDAAGIPLQPGLCPVTDVAREKVAALETVEVPALPTPATAIGRPAVAEESTQSIGSVIAITTLAALVGFMAWVLC